MNSVLLVLPRAFPRTARSFPAVSAGAWVCLLEEPVLWCAQ